MKTCSKCGIEKPLDAFQKVFNGRYTYAAACKECHKVYCKSYYNSPKGKAAANRKKQRPKAMTPEQKAKRKETLAKYFATEEGKRKEIAWRKKYRQTEEFRKKRAEYYLTEQYQKAKAEYRKTGAIKESVRRTYLKRRLLASEKLNDSIRSAIYEALKGRKKGRHWETLVGYTLKDLMEHIEKQFIEGMSWDNYGEWHIDHIYPQAAFFFTDITDIDFRRCWGLDNLRPLWKVENHRKNAKIIKPFQPSLDLLRKVDITLDKNI